MSRPPTRPPCIGAEPGNCSVSAANPLLTDCGFAGGEVDFVGTFFSMSSYKSRIKSSLKRPNVEQAVVKPVRLG